jgi:hypothetical protein
VDCAGLVRSFDQFPLSGRSAGTRTCGESFLSAGSSPDLRRAFRLKIDDEIPMGRRSQVAGSVLRSSRFGKNVLGPSQLAVGQRDPRSVSLGAAYGSD